MGFKNSKVFVFVLNIVSINISEITKQYPERARECNYFLAAANYKIGKYRIALKHVNTVLLIEPENLQALDLKEKIENKLTNGIHTL